MIQPYTRQSEMDTYRVAPSPVTVSVYGFVTSVVPDDKGGHAVALLVGHHIYPAYREPRSSAKIPTPGTWIFCLCAINREHVPIISPEAPLIIVGWSKDRTPPKPD